MPSKKKTSEFFEYSSCPMSVVNFNGIILEVNSAWTNHLGWSIDDLVGQSVLKFIHAEDQNGAWLSHAKFFSSKLNIEKANFNCRYLHKNGSYLEFSCNSTIVPAKGKVFAIANSMAAKEVAISFVQPDPRYKQIAKLLDAIPSSIGYWDSDLRCIHANSAYARLYNKTPDEIRGKSLADISDERQLNLVLPKMQQALKGIPQSFEDEVLTLNTFFSQVSVKYIPDLDAGQVKGFLVLMQDISAIKSLEAERNQTQVKLMNSAKMSSLGEMAGGLAHEINNPLTIIIGKASQLANRIESGKQDLDKSLDDLRRIEQTALRIAKIVNGLRVFSRNADKDLMSKTSVEKIVEDTFELCRQKLKYNNIKLTVKGLTGIQIECRSSQISQALLNILNNAHDAIEALQEKWIEIEATSDGEFVTIFVTDSGRGIASDIQEKIMQPFFTTKDVGKGTGLGLSISKGLVESHNGCIYFDAKHQHTRFVIELPILQPVSI